MSDTIKNIEIPSGTWVNLYTESEIAIGTKIEAENVGYSVVYLVASATIPTGGLTSGYSRVRPYDVGINDSGDTGAYAYAVSTTFLNVRESA